MCTDGELRGRFLCTRASGATAALQDLYRQVDADVARLGAACRGCGDCCRFDVADHRLLVTTAELALLTERPPPNRRGPGEGRCPYQVAERCTARRRRPLGCRVFFCDPRFAGPARDLYEHYHGAIQRLHGEFRLAYRYVELTAALAAVSFAPATCSGEQNPPAVCD
jgi:Fe-S-cluster containining protein